MKHFIGGQELSLEQVKQLPVPESTATLPVVNDNGTIVVRGFQQPINKEIMELYFTNTSKSGGGKIADIVIREKEVFIVFTNRTGIYTACSRSCAFIFKLFTMLFYR